MVSPANQSMTSKMSNCKDIAFEATQSGTASALASQCGGHLEEWLDYIYRIIYDVKNFRKKAFNVLYEG